MKSLTLIFCFVVLFSGCASSRREVVYLGTKSYEKRVSGFTVDFTTARKKMVDFYTQQTNSLPASPSSRMAELMAQFPKDDDAQKVQRDDRKVMLGASDHRVIVGDWYHFHSPDKQGRISKFGVQVNGFTGEVKSVSTMDRLGEYY